MREIKFRAWDNGKMYYKGFIIWPDGATEFPQGGWDVSGMDEKLELMQYTGLNDKNNKYIFDGDILNIGEPGHAVPCEVVFYDGCFSIIADWNKELRIPLKEYCNNVFKNCVEIIGNKYENSDLLCE